MRGHNRVALGARTWYRPALWSPQGSGSTKTLSSRSSAITGSLPHALRPQTTERRKGQLPGLSPVCGHRLLSLYRPAILALFPSSASPFLPC